MRHEPDILITERSEVRVMAKHDRHKQREPPLVIITSFRNQALGALGNGDALHIGAKVPINNSIYVYKVECWARIDALTAAQGAGMKLCLVDGDLGVTEVPDGIDAEGPLGPNDRVTREKAERPVWIGSTLDLVEGATQGSFKDGETNGPKIVIRPKWTFQEDKGWNWTIVNQSGSSITTGSTILITEKVFGRWRR